MWKLGNWQTKNPRTKGRKHEEETEPFGFVASCLRGCLVDLWNWEAEMSERFDRIHLGRAQRIGCFLRISRFPDFPISQF
jgi:hypothetical protein